VGAAVECLCGVCGMRVWRPPRLCLCCVVCVVFLCVGGSVICVCVFVCGGKAVLCSIDVCSLSVFAFAWKGFVFVCFVCMCVWDCVCVYVFDVCVFEWVGLCV